MNTQVNKPAPAAVVEAKTGRRCYTYIIAVSGRLWSLCAREWWGTPEGMHQNAASMATAARIFRHTAAVAVYELRDDDYYYYVKAVPKIDSEKAKEKGVKRREEKKPVETVSSRVRDILDTPTLDLPETDDNLV